MALASGDNNDLTSADIAIVGVASPYAFDVVESSTRLGLGATCIDNFGDALTTLPRLQQLTQQTSRSLPFTLGLSSASHRATLLDSCAQENFMTPLSLIDPTAIVASTTTFGHACYVNAGVVMGSQSSIGCGTNINRSVSIGHDNRLGSCVSVGPGAVLAGHVVLEDLVTVGAGAVVLPGITVHRGATVGAGAVVTKDVPAHTVVVGNPARELSTTEPTHENFACPYCSRGTTVMTTEKL